MIELRKDYVLDRWVIISEKRGSRPKEFTGEEHAKPVKVDYFAPGNEDLTPLERGRVSKGGSWQVRWFENKFPAVKRVGQSEIVTHNDFYTFASAFGEHLIVVETPDDRQLAEFSVDEIRLVFEVYAKLIDELDKDPIKYVSVFKNHGLNAGTSILHSHSQVIAYNLLPVSVNEKLKVCESHCPYGVVVEREKDSDRRCFENDFFVAFTPYASRFNYEVWVFPKLHLKRFDDFSEEHFQSLADIMKKVLLKLHELKADYNFFVYYSPKGKDMRFHVEVTPRIAKWGGFELSTGTVINTVSPERAAAFYRS